MLELNKIYNMDCLEGLKQIDDNSIDFVLTDPPFNVKLKYNNSQDNMSSDEYEKWCVQWLSEIYRILKDGHYGVVATSDINSGYIFNALKSSGLYFIHFLKWFKPNAHTMFSGTTFFWNTEILFLFSKGHPKYKLIHLKKLNTDTISANALSRNYLDEDNYIVEHPAQRPIKLYEKIINGFTVDEDLIVDCFIGSGTTALACKKTNRKFIGFEIDKIYHKMAEDRFNKMFIAKKDFGGYFK